MNLDPPLRRIRSRRLSSCYRHPAQPLTGFCALCLRDRLATLDSSEPVVESQSESVAGANAVSSMRLLRRSKSVIDGRHEVASTTSDQRRRSCDVRVSSSTLSHLFVRDNVVKLVENEDKVKSTELGFENRDGFRTLDEVMVLDFGEDDVVEEELKTMKEHIDIECTSRRKSNAHDLREIAGNLFGAASVFSNKLKTWRQKEKSKRKGECSGGETDQSAAGMDWESVVVDYGFGRRSCDTEPRFSIDVNRMSVDDSRFSLDEPPRASWDGYLIARTIPRLTPMLSVVDNVMVGPMNKVDKLQMKVINEDVGNFGESGQSISDYSSSNRPRSTDQSISIKNPTKKLELESDELGRISDVKVPQTNDVIFHGTKLVITEKELKEWHLNSLKHVNLENAESISLTNGSDSNGVKKVTKSRWHKVCNLWGHKQKSDQKKGGELIGKGGPEKLGKEINGLQKGNSSAKLVRSSSVVGSRIGNDKVGSYGSARDTSKKVREEFVLERNKSGRHSMSDLDSGLLRFHLTPFTNYSESKSGKK